MTRYVGLFRGSREEGWQVSFPDLPGCFAKGDNFRDAFQAARNALADELAPMDDPPRPRTTAEILIDARRDPSLARALVGAVMQLVPYEDQRDPMFALPRTHGAPPLRHGAAMELAG